MCNAASLGHSTYTVLLTPGEGMVAPCPAVGSASRADPTCAVSGCASLMR